MGGNIVGDKTVGKESRRATDDDDEAISAEYQSGDNFSRMTLFEMRDHLRGETLSVER